MAKKKCGGCGRKKTVAQMQQSNSLRSTEESNMTDKNYVLVLYTHPNRGRHGVIGAITKKNYGHRGGGDQFLVHIDDVKARPDHFRIIQHAEKVFVPTPMSTPPPPPRPIAAEEMKNLEALPHNMQKVNMLPEAEKQILDLQKEEIIQLTKPHGFIELGALPGVTPAIESNLRKEGVVTLDDFRERGVDGLVKIKFIGTARAEAIMLYIESLEVGSGNTDDPEPDSSSA